MTNSSVKSSGMACGLRGNLERSMQTMYKKITGRILGIFFIFCGIGSMFTTDMLWPVTAIFMLAGFMAIPLPNNRKLLI